MNLEEYKIQQYLQYLFDPVPFGIIYSFIDFANVRPWAKDFWPEENKYRICSEIDISKLAELCDLVHSKRKYFYYGYFSEQQGLNYEHKENVKHRNSIYRIDKARESGFALKTKAIKMIPHYDEDGKFLGKIPKCNFDVEMTMDMLTKIVKYDTAMIFSGDSDFGNLLKYLKIKGKKIIIISTRNRMSTELQSVADKFIPAETLKNLLKYENKKNTPPIKAEV